MRNTKVEETEIFHIKAFHAHPAYISTLTPHFFPPPSLPHSVSSLFLAAVSIKSLSLDQANELRLTDH